jgi:hypothetical protein
MRSRTGFDATVLKFTKGQWSAGKDGTRMNDVELIAHVDQSMFGWIKWENKRMADFDIGLTRERFRPKRRHDLGDNDPNTWVKGDPWQFTFLLPLSAPKTGQLYMYSTTSRGGKDALAKVQDAYADHCEMHPKEAHKLPAVCLAADWYPHPEYGRVETPCFDIVGWVDPPPGVKQIRPPASTSVLAIEHKTIDATPEPETENPGAGMDAIPF